MVFINVFISFLWKKKKLSCLYLLKIFTWLSLQKKKKKKLKPSLFDDSDGFVLITETCVAL